jgi:lipopolysaccharide export system protein LptA
VNTSIHPFFFSRLYLFPALLAASVIIMANPFCLKAQNKVQIIHSDSIKGGTIHGRKIQKILGEVHLKTKKFNMFADSAYKFLKQNKVIAYGNIEIDTKEQSIWSDTLTYYTDKDYSKLRGRVIIESDSTSLFGSSVNYHFKTEIAHFLSNIRLVDSNGILTAQKGYFYRKADSAVFRGNVQLKDSLKYLEGDSLFSNRRTGYNELYGNVFGDDPANNSKLSGDYLQSDSAGKRVIKGHAWLINYKNTTSKEDTSKVDSLPAPERASSHRLKDSTQVFQSDSVRITPTDTLRHPTTDSLFNPLSDSTHSVHSDTSQTTQPDTTEIHAYKIVSIAHRTTHDTTTTVKAFQNVRIWSSNFSAISNMAKFNSKTHIYELWTNTKTRHKNVQATQPSIQDSSKTDPLHLAPVDTLNKPPEDSLSTPISDSTHTARRDTSSITHPDTTKTRANKKGSIPSQTPDDTTTTIKTFKNDSARSSNSAAIPDTARDNSKTHIYEPLSNAKAWHKNIQLTGPYIKVILKNGDIKRLISFPHPFAVQQDTAIDRLNQIKGDSLTATFNKGQLDLIRVTGNSHLLRFTEKENEPDGYIEVQAPVTNIFFDKGKLVKMKNFSGKEEPTGHYMPKGEQTSKKQLKGFAWNPDKRPKKPEKSMHRRLQPIPQKPPFRLPKKYLEHIHPHVSLPDSLSTKHDTLSTQGKKNRKQHKK